MATPDISSAQPPLPAINTLWNFGDVTATRNKFLELLPQAQASGDKSYYLQLLTQLARTHSLQNNFDEAHKILDTVEKQLNPDLKVARVRYLLERGRCYNSSNQQERSIPYFMEAVDIAHSINETRLEVDAIHMVAIAKSDPKDQVEWNLKGIERATATSEKGWLHALYNNIGESYLRLKEYDNAYKYFHLLAELQKEQSGESDIYTLKDEAKALTLGGKPQEALVILEPVSKKLTESNEENGWIENEVAEALYALNRKGKAQPHFKKAYELLSKDDYCIKYEPERLEHLKTMAEQ